MLMIINAAIATTIKRNHHSAQNGGVIENLKTAGWHQPEAPSFALTIELVFACRQLGK